MEILRSIEPPKTSPTETSEVTPLTQTETQALTPEEKERERMLAEHAEIYEWLGDDINNRR